MLDFALAHARARDAVHAQLDIESLRAELGAECLILRSAAPDRETFLRRPDLGRRLVDDTRIADCDRRDLAIILADGLSATAVQMHGPIVARRIRELLRDWTIAEPVIALQARVALGDDIGARLKAEAVVVLIGERPGLSSTDSLGAYLTWHPLVGRRDAERNCVSNIRASGGLAPDEAAAKIVWLLHEARRLGRSGITIKDRHASPPSIGSVK